MNRWTRERDPAAVTEAGADVEVGENAVVEGAPRGKPSSISFGQRYGSPLKRHPLDDASLSSISTHSCRLVFPFTFSHLMKL